MIEDSKLKATLKQCAERLGVTETAAVHMAVNRLYVDLFPERVACDAPTDAQIAEVNARNHEHGDSGT